VSVAPVRSQVRLARQPLVDRAGELYGYELLFRGPGGPGAVSGDRATAEVLVTAACDLGWERLGGGLPLFLNVDVGLLSGPLIDLAPVELTVIEVLEGIDVGHAVVARVSELRERGYRIALDDYVPGSTADLLLPLADVVKIDVLDQPEHLWDDLVRELHARGALVVAEKVEDARVHERALAAGFDLFQGYWFARPSDQHSSVLSPRVVVCLRLVNLLSQDDADLRAIEELVTSDPMLTLRVLRMANSAAVGGARSVSSVRQALVMVGPATLSGWVALMLLAGEDGPEPIVATEVLVLARACQIVGDSRYGDGGPPFLAGLVVALSERMRLDPAAVLSSLGAGPDIRAAVLQGAGRVGALVREVDRHVSGLEVDSDLDVQMAHLAAVVWSRDLLAMV
jgi:c-di-GMP-related signal transduction protein